MDRRTRTRIVAVILAAVLVLSLAGSLLSTAGSGDDGGADQSQSLVTDQSLLPGPDDGGDEGTVTEDTVTEDTAPARYSDLPVVYVSELPDEAIDTILLIDRGGPFPFDRDGITFFNREGLLPANPEGWYKEYTVITPGEDDRGARRIVVGQDGAVFYTDDHYESFREVVGD